MDMNHIAELTQNQITRWAESSGADGVDCIRAYYPALITNYHNALCAEVLQKTGIQFEKMCIELDKLRLENSEPETN